MTNTDMKRLVTGKKPGAVVLNDRDAWKSDGRVIYTQAADGWEVAGTFGDEKDARFAARTASAHYRIVAKAQRVIDALRGVPVPSGVVAALRELREEIRG